MAANYSPFLQGERRDHMDFDIYEMKDLCNRCERAGKCLYYAEKTNFAPHTRMIVVKCDAFKRKESN